MTLETNSREQEIRQIWKDYRFFYQVFGGLVLVGIGIAIGGVLFAADSFGYSMNVYMNVLSVLVTVFVIDLLNRRRDERRDLRQLQEQLVRDASSLSNDVALNAIHQLRKRNWLRRQSGILKGVDLGGANLQSAYLPLANLAGASLARANLQGANLASADLQGASLWNANLEGANLEMANLGGVNMEHTGLHKASLANANLAGAILVGAILDEATILPDRTYWMSETDLKRFTDPKHPNFWRSEHLSSPAYRGDSPAALEPTK